ncbi:unnamed protein product [Coregonus sp. 'balchen']|nr:unnamed protein product [Coregonus sp. 'balchen']
MSRLEVKLKWTEWGENVREGEGGEEEGSDAERDRSGKGRRGAAVTGEQKEGSGSKRYRDKVCVTEKQTDTNKHKPWIETEYQGIVMENDNTVLLNPPLFALDKDAPLHYAGEICGFRVHNGPSGSSSVQFEAVVLDRSTGEGLIRSKEPLDCESQREHSFTIQAYDCGEGPDGANSKKSHKATVHVRVNDVNEFSPVFVERRYEASVPEGRLFDRIVRVEALDADCSPQYSQICFYDIITPNVPFVIDNDGNIKNTEPLDSKRQRVHTFWVTAFDCGKNRAQADAQVVVTVKPLHLETCEETVWNIQATVELQTGHIGKGCDRDSYSDRSVRRLCGAVRGEVDLLPPPSPAANWTSALPTLPSSDSSLVFSFNGSTHVAVVPDSVAAAVSGDHFTLQLWMRRGGINTQPPTNQARGNRREEETIVCDSEWHHLSLSVQFPSVTLCFNEESCLTLRQLEGYLVVLQPDAPQISLSGVGPHLARPAPEFEGPRGVPLFPELRIVCSLSHAVNTAAQGMEGGALMSDAVAHTLDGCEVQPLGEELNPEREELLMDMDALRERGAESISVYEDVLRSVRYRLAKGSARFERRFRLSCSEMNGRYTSNELTLEVNFLHSLDSLYHPSHLLASQQQFLHPSHHSGELSGHTLPNPHHNSVVPGAATVIIMVCVGFLVIMVILGVFRIRSIHRRGEGARGGSKEDSGQWDDSALTIIVNPMESYESRMGISADTEGEGEEDEEVVESPDDANDDQRIIIIKKEGRDSNPRRY